MGWDLWVLRCMDAYINEGVEWLKGISLCMHITIVCHGLIEEIYDWMVINGIGLHLCGWGLLTPVMWRARRLIKPFPKLPSF